ncbi:metallophosphoesterase [uncultured Campylobacter sp.]|uniref:metallophosphoesterase n=1 Tax=uncultured Campylobacter sp. TaxID=218934 RepID=UPI003456CCCC
MSLGKAAARIAAAGTAAGFAAGLWSLVEAQAFALRRRTLVLDPRSSSARVLGEQAAAAGSTSSTPKAPVVRQGDASDRPFSPAAQDAVSLDDGDPRRLRILHLSDIHLLAWQRRKLAWIEKLAGEDPDLLILTGDSIAHSAAVAPLLRTLSVFAGLPGLFVFGSNDYYPPRPKNPFTYFKAPSIAFSTTAKVATRVFPSPVFISAIAPSFSTKPPIS